MVASLGRRRLVPTLLVVPLPGHLLASVPAARVISSASRRGGARVPRRCPRRCAERRPMKVASILKSKGGRVVTMRPDSSITSVIQRMKLERIGAIVISADGERIDGIVSERDIVYGLADQHGDFLALKVSDVMTREVITCTPEDRIKQVMARMTHSRVRHVPVVDSGRL